jgi:hypothetical protein
VVSFIPVIEFTVGQMRYSFLLADLYRFGQQRIRGALVEMTCFAGQIQDRCHLTSVNDLAVSDHFLADARK